MRRATLAAIWGWGVILAAAAAADDWPRWRGPRADGISRETGLLAEWPKEGPPQLWRTALGGGFSSISVVGDRAFTSFSNDEAEFVTCLDAGSGKTLWKTRLGELFENSYGNGPRATPAVDGPRVYALSGKGVLACVDAADGQLRWSHDLVKKFGGEPPEFGFSASPAVVGKLLVAVVGAHQGKSLVAFDKQSGDVVWTALDDKAGYSTPLSVEVQGVPQLIVLMGEALVSVAPDSGREYWRHEWKTTLDANVATPIFHDNRLFISTGYGTGCGLFELSVSGGKPAARLAWANKEMKNYFSSSVLVEGHVYGFNNTMLTCMEFASGEAKWKQRGFNRGTLLAADGKLVILGERATLALADVSPEKYREISRAEILGDRTWTVPTLSGGRLFVRNEKEIACLKVK